jgi:hypothetical protein
LGQPKDSVMCYLKSEYKIVNIGTPKFDHWCIMPNNYNSILESLATIFFRDGRVSGFYTNAGQLMDENGANFALKLISLLAQYGGRQDVYIIDDSSGPMLLDDPDKPEVYSSRDISLYFGHKYITIRYTATREYSHADITEGITEISQSKLVEYKAMHAKSAK